MTEISIPLGFEVGTGEPVAVPLYHLAVVGQTQQSGKTTTLEGLIARAPGVRAVAFKTKRGEASFDGARLVKPYFQDTAGEGRPYWEFIETLLASAMKQSMKFERAWIVKAAEGAKTLRDVRANIEPLKEAARRGMDKDLFLLLGEYLDIVLPQIARLPSASRVELHPGLNVMDLTAFTDEMQQLVVRSVIEWVHQRERNVVTIIPEAWKFLPHARMTPVKPSAEKLIREGAVLGNFVWMDSQDITGLWKLALKAATVWLLGVQREANEVKHTLKNIPEHTHKPKAADVMKLGRGQFFACHGETVKRVYVQPAWLDAEPARRVARGVVPVGDVQQQKPQPAKQEAPAVSENAPQPAVDLRELYDRMDNLTSALVTLAGVLERAAVGAPSASTARGDGKTSSAPTVDVDAITRTVLERVAFAASEGKLKVNVTEHEIEVTNKRQVIQMDGATLPGRIARLLAEGFFDSPKGHRSVWDEVVRRGFKGSNNVQRELEKLAEKGFLTKEPGQGFRAVEGMKVNIIEED